MMSNMTPGVKKVLYLHLAAAIFMTIQTIAIFVIPLSVSIPQTVGFPSRASNGPLSSPMVKQVYTINPKYLIGAFLALASIDHWICTLIGFLRAELFARYLLDKEANPLRWLEYSVSASIMSVLLAALTGVYDVHLLFCIGALTGICNLTGLVVEFMPKQVNGERNNAAFGTYLIGWIAIVVSWLPPLCYFFQAVAADGKDVPAFVIVAYMLTALCYVAFGLNFQLHWFNGKYSFVTSEIVYISLSFTAKTILAWDVFGGFKAAEK
eukprot:TRINITY_DN7605_c0_g1_i1.p1 TRINITY_DN7605_c0_g1~~TRINITY_DN7605_c0_g1_i1.p1  ORF type:complete len:266 (-),score=48.49 TRINITY_DN7605_c0_g1_i1:244-1041(-)